MKKRKAEPAFLSEMFTPYRYFRRKKVDMSGYVPMRYGVPGPSIYLHPQPPVSHVPLGIKPKGPM